ncbi:hypothetical protein CYMTET_10504 [Cymbomonas tetramitiformis]|uniref:Uncharacterized protein n=1 Tax=Cymbomonas tetramitiformis TaxID=36881 RepID=A0AAE0GP52_9CHLO|nr:hypothetical protein CYMTET_10504 [Cymbomonas tetramitiformis]
MSTDANLRAKESQKWTQLAYNTSTGYETSSSAHGKFFQMPKTPQLHPRGPTANTHAEDWHHHFPQKEAEKLPTAGTPRALNHNHKDLSQTSLSWGDRAKKKEPYLCGEDKAYHCSQSERR